MPAKPTGPTVTMSCVGCWAHWKVGVCVAGVKDITDMLDSVERSHQWNWNLSLNAGMSFSRNPGVGPLMYSSSTALGSDGQALNASRDAFHARFGNVT